MDSDSDSDFYGDDDQVAALESRADDFDVRAYWRQIEHYDTVHPGRRKGEPSPTPSSAAMTPAAAKPPKLHNPYEGQVCAKQLGETMSDFLARLPPATTDVTLSIPWIYVANPFIPREGGGVEEAPVEPGAQLSTFIEGGGERLQLFGDFLRTVDEKKRAAGAGRLSTAMSRQAAAEREGCVNDILMLARVMKVRTGKWMLFVEPNSVNEVWASVAQATARNELGIAAKVAPREERGSARERLVCIYTHDFRDKDDIARVLHRLRQLELVRDRAGGKPIYYKADAFTYLGIGSGNPWGLRASLYSSRDIFAHLREKEGKTPTKKEAVVEANEDGEEGWEF
ncbi:hypothetical protein KVR01_007111 [Diaporthe batatas]|uniref:uncharacterized protein n=1 Tax=Diaporthe batatas TaxID=748121 RepID=UPI001D049734|nr:uncharacterized protein KVR01_007111 [Diaporthe batatas]KAG8162633.1 hypothetical protein KVR01_007111 [Diaporthe batatas]